MDKWISTENRTKMWIRRVLRGLEFHSFMPICSAFCHPRKCFSYQVSILTISITHKVLLPKTRLHIY